MLPEFKWEAKIGEEWHAKTMLVNGKDRYIVGQVLANEGGSFIERTYIDGATSSHPEWKGPTGSTETVLGVIIPSSHVDPRILVNGESIAKPEYHDAFTAYKEAYTEHLVELVIYEAILTAQSQLHELMAGTAEFIPQELPQPQAIAA